MKLKNAFTLIEVMIAIAIIALLGTLTIYLLNPIEILSQSHDSARVSSLNTLTLALELARSNQVSLGVPYTLYISIPDPLATSTVGDQCQGIGLIPLPTGWAYHCASPATYLKVDGTGWLPVNFGAIPGGGSPVNPLPVDPVNASSSDFYYTYGLVNGQWELSAVMESNKEISISANDGGIDPIKYEVGTIGITPFTHGFVGFWPFDEGTGATTADLSGYGATGAITNPVWTTGKIGQAIDLSSPTANIDFGPLLNTYANSNLLTITSWIYPEGASSFGFPPNQWLFIATIYNVSAQTAAIYVNGQFIANLSNVSSGFPASPVISPASAVPALPSLWDDLRLYNRALTQAQIQGIYTATQ